jgi:hypothetical protein
VQLEISAFVTPDVTPSAFSAHSAPLNISNKSLILKMERVKGIEPSSSAWKTNVRQDLAGQSRTDDGAGTEAIGEP